MGKMRMKAIEKSTVDIDSEAVPFNLPGEVTVYAIDSVRIALAPKPIRLLEDVAMYSGRAKVSRNGKHYRIEMPARVYDFYHLEEADYTVMTSEVSPRTVEILLG